MMASTGFRQFVIPFGPATFIRDHWLKQRQLLVERSDQTRSLLKRWRQERPALIALKYYTSNLNTDGRCSHRLPVLIADRKKIHSGGCLQAPAWISAPPLFIDRFSHILHQRSMAHNKGLTLLLIGCPWRDIAPAAAKIVLPGGI